MWAQEGAPGPVGMDMPPVAFATNGKVTNVFTANLTASTVFDDNAFGYGTDRVSDLEYYFSPVFGFQQTRKHLKFNMTYAPSVDISQRFQDRYTQMGGLELSYIPTARLSFHARQDYAITTDPFQDVLQNGDLPPLNPQNRPNNPVIFPYLKQTILVSNAGVTYRVTRHTSIGLNGYFSDSHYDNDAGGGLGSTLISARVASGSLYLSHQVSARQTFGFEYTQQGFFFNQTDSRTRAYNFNFFDDIAITHRSKLSFYFGPEYTRTQGQSALNLLFFVIEIPVQNTAWSGAGGATYSWNGDRTAIQASYTRGVNEGGGFLGAVWMSSGSVQIHRKLGYRLEADLGGQISNNTAIGLSSNQYQYRQVSGAFGLSRQLNPRTSVRLSYSRLNQNSGYINQLGNHDRIQFSLSYQLRKPLGR